jgi:tRNA (mo5U34)-methyltransferase
MTLSEKFLRAGVRFYHASIPLPDGSKTAMTENGIDCTGFETVYGFDKIAFSGKSVLDVGCWDGAWAFMAEQKGATEVVGLDNVDFRMWDKGNNSAWEALHSAYQSKAKYVHGTVYSLPFADKSFDIVYCLGLLYHLSDPLKALHECFRCCRERLVVEVWGTRGQDATIRLVAPREVNAHDPTNVYCISEGWLTKVAKMHGFTPVHINTFWGCRLCMQFVHDRGITPNLHPSTIYP